MEVESRKVEDCHILIYLEGNIPSEAENRMTIGIGSDIIYKIC